MTAIEAELLQIKTSYDERFKLFVWQPVKSNINAYR